MLLVLIFLCFNIFNGSNGEANANAHSKRLFEKVMTGYNKLIRPVAVSNDTLTVRFKLKLSQLIDVHEKNQIMTTNVWLKQVWTDYKLRWNPDDYGGVRLLHIPADMIWLPDIVLYNNADGNYQVSIMTKALVYSNGTVHWEPPAIYKSMCQIDVTWFPFDSQKCELKFGSWTYDGTEVDLNHYDAKCVEETDDEGKTVWSVARGIDVEGMYRNVEWDIMKVPGDRHVEKYSCCPAEYVDLTYKIHLRRKTLFYTVNLIIPCVSLSFLTIIVFYLPCDCGEKVSLCISILICLTVFFLLLVEIIPSTSLVIPLIAKYLLFTMVMVTLSISVTVVISNVHFRTPNTHNMPDWVKKLFLKWLPYVLVMRRPHTGGDDEADPPKWQQRSDSEDLGNPGPLPRYDNNSQFLQLPQGTYHKYNQPSDYYGNSRFNERVKVESTPRVEAFFKTAIDSACFIAEHLKSKDADDEVSEDWRYVAMVMDRMLLYIFVVTCTVATLTLFLNAPLFSDTSEPINFQDDSSNDCESVNGGGVAIDPRFWMWLVTPLVWVLGQSN